MAAALIANPVKDVIVIEGTGTGKSAIMYVGTYALGPRFQVAVYILPLIALVDQLGTQLAHEFGAAAVVRWSSTSTPCSGSTRVILVSADILGSNMVQSRLRDLSQANRIGFIAFEEIHIPLSDASYRPALEGFSVFVAQNTIALDSSLLRLYLQSPLKMCSRPCASTLTKPRSSEDLALRSAKS